MTLATQDADERDELIGWRLYYLHRGRLCSPGTGDLTPVEADAEAVCLYHRHKAPALGCYCGWRVADDIDAIVPAALEIAVPVRMLPTRARLRSEHPEPGDNVWGFPERTLWTWDWPAPALVRVRGYGGVLPTDDLQYHREALDALQQRHGFTAPGEDSRILGYIDEGWGMWRARAVQIIGPVITANSPDYQFYAPPNAGDMARHYGVKHLHHDRVWEELVPELAANPAAAEMPPRPPKQRSSLPPKAQAARRTKRKAEKRARKRSKR